MKRHHQRPTKTYKTMWSLIVHLSNTTAKEMQTISLRGQEKICPMRITITFQVNLFCIHPVFLSTFSFPDRQQRFICCWHVDSNWLMFTQVQVLLDSPFRFSLSQTHHTHSYTLDRIWLIPRKALRMLMTAWVMRFISVALQINK